MSLDTHARNFLLPKDNMYTYHEFINMGCPYLKKRNKKTKTKSQTN